MSYLRQSSLDLPRTLTKVLLDRLPEELSRYFSQEALYTFGLSKIRMPPSCHKNQVIVDFVNFSLHKTSGLCYVRCIIVRCFLGVVICQRPAKLPEEDPRVVSNTLRAELQRRKKVSD